MDRHTDKRLAYAWKCGILGFIFSCAVGWDHIWVWVLDTVPPVVLHTEGRPYHTPVVFLLYAMVVSLGIIAFTIRRSDIEK